MLSSADERVTCGASAVIAFIATRQAAPEVPSLPLRWGRELPRPSGVLLPRQTPVTYVHVQLPGLSKLIALPSAQASASSQRERDIRRRHIGQPVRSPACKCKTLFARSPRDAQAVSPGNHYLVPAGSLR